MCILHIGITLHTLNHFTHWLLHSKEHITIYMWQHVCAPWWPTRSAYTGGSVILLAAAAHNLNFTALAISGLCMYTANWVLVLHFPVSMYLMHNWVYYAKIQLHGVCRVKLLFMEKQINPFLTNCCTLLTYWTQNNETKVQKSHICQLFP